MDSGTVRRADVIAQQQTTRPPILRSGIAPAATGRFVIHAGAPSRRGQGEQCARPKAGVCPQTPSRALALLHLLERALALRPGELGLQRIRGTRACAPASAGARETPPRPRSAASSSRRAPAPVRRSARTARRSGRSTPAMPAPSTAMRISSSGELAVARPGGMPSQRCSPRAAPTAPARRCARAAAARRAPSAPRAPPARRAAAGSPATRTGRPRRRRGGAPRASIVGAGRPCGSRRRSSRRSGRRGAATGRAPARSPDAARTNSASSAPSTDVREVGGHRHAQPPARLDLPVLRQRRRRFDLGWPPGCACSSTLWPNSVTRELARGAQQQALAELRSELRQCGATRSISAGRRARPRG